MQFAEVVQRRRMVRNYTGEPVGPEVLDRILDTGVRIPSAGFSQGVFLVAVTDEKTRSEIARLCGEEEYVADGFDAWISRAPVHILVCVSAAVYADRYAAEDKGGPDSPMAKASNWPVPYWWVDGGAAMQNLLLAAVDEGLAAGFLGSQRMPEIKALLGIPGDVSPIGIVTIGHPAPDRRSGSLKRGRRPDTIHRDRW
ncbi:MAG: nitroreductase family protein [Acidimicrobiia bacterium]|nr:MAG: nitroreductase family protein [Acidimicrobiia bacterium]